MWIFSALPNVRQVLTKIISYGFYFFCMACYVCTEPPRDKTNKMTAPSEDSDQPGHLPSLMRVFAVSKYPSFLHADSEDSDQTGWVPRLIWVFAGGTCIFIGFVMRWFIWQFLIFGISISCEIRRRWSVYLDGRAYLYFLCLYYNFTMCHKKVKKVLSLT